MRKAWLGVTWVLWTVAGACGPGSEAGRVERTDSAGVELVVSEGNDVGLDWTAQRLFSVGGAEEGPESFHMVTAGVLGSDSLGHLYVLDPQSHRVVVFDTAGSLIRTLGEQGEGPGEVRLPGSMSVGPGGEVAVFDFGKRALVRFGSAGDVLPEQVFVHPPIPGVERHIEVTPSGTLVATMGSPVEEGTFREVLRLVSASDTVLVADRSFPRAEMVRYPSCGGGLNLPRIFEPQMAWDAEGGRVAVVRTARYEVEIYEEGRLVGKVRRQLAPRTATRDMALAELGEGFPINFGRGLCTIPPEEMIDQRGYTEVLPWASQVTLAPSGELWVERKAVGPDAAGPVDVFSRDGAYLGTLPEGTPFPLLFLGPERFAARETDQFDVSRVVVYELDRGPQ